MDRPPAPRKRRARRVGFLAALAALPLAAAYRFALVYRVRAGYPRQHRPVYEPSDVGLPFERVDVPTVGAVVLPGWFIPAGPGPAPGVVIVHGWESARDRMLPHAMALHAAGLHVLTVDVRGHGVNAPERLPISAGEYGADALAGVRTMLARADVTAVALFGHSMGAAGALIAAAREPRVGAVVAVSTPADPYRLTRQTFRLVRLPLPDAIAYPLAWLTTRVYLRPRGHRVEDVSASRAVRDIAAPVLLVHGDQDGVVPVGHLARLAALRRAARPDAVTETLTIAGGHHSWLHEFPEFRTTVARFLVRSLGGAFGGLSPDEAAARAATAPAVRLPEVERLTAVDAEPGGFRTLAGIVQPVAADGPPDGASLTNAAP